ncbi:exodeoxyribonuclease V subunit gamma [Buchnera aphidicola]|uniref:exodeoxyribonuclease V subunit gamma n=1 Tax=Buchnera aphidicola TaxID=9 RepID=UPI0029057B5B|nr:exodeoxyribonuclease V subunit gamma [Buchnera aphidicola]
MFIIYKSNNLNHLLLKATHIIRDKPLDNIFSKEIFIHDHLILFEYLNIFIAQKIGISANLQYYHPDVFIWKLFEKLLLKKKINNIFTSSIIMWKIVKILDHKKFVIPFNIKNNNFEKLKFSFLMANIFKQYIFYRPDWINEFEKNKNILKFNHDEQWQIKLWIEIINDIKKNNQSVYHFSNLFQSFQLLIQEKKINKTCLPCRLFVISSFSLNPSYIKILKEISLYIDVYFLYTTPYKYNIFNIIKNTKSIETKNIYKKNVLNNSLIKLWGQYAKIYEFHIIESEKIKIIHYFKKNKNNNLLKNIQNDFLKKFPKKKKDYYNQQIIQFLSIFVIIKKMKLKYYMKNYCYF